MIRQVSTDRLVLDTMAVVAASVKVIGEHKDVPFYFDYDSPGQNAIVFTGERSFGQLHISYRVFPFKAQTSYRLKDTLLIRERFEAESPFSFKPSDRDPVEAYSRFGGLDKRGSISRGILVGNAQDLSVNSDLNLQLRGQLTERISILADISDDNIPIQAEGNTQQLQEFDQVYIKLYDEKNALTAGDFQLRRTSPYFLHYIKKARGASFVHDSRGSETFSNDSLNHFIVKAAAAVSRGKFSRNVVQGVEGNQGPYRLRGADNEQFIIVLSGTERVYIDGRPLERGLDQDYVIDYNTAEITFTARQLITKDKRIVAEFQYSERNFARSLFAGGAEMKNEKLHAFVDLYSEQDSRNQSLQQELSPEDRLLLSNVGDNLLNAVTPRIENVGFSEDEVLYALRDSLGYDSIYVYSTLPEEAVFRLSFTQVGEGRGDYIQDDFVPSGRVFRWIAPDTVGGVIVPQGEYAPVLLLVTPKARRMYAAGATFTPNERTRLHIEGAISENDLNTFSDLNQEDDLGHAFAIDMERLHSLRRDSGRTVHLSTAVRYEQTAEFFKPIERYRRVEYERNWNLSPIDEMGLQHLVTATVGLKRSPKRYIDLQSEFLEVDDKYSGVRNGLSIKWHQGKWKTDLVGSLLSSEGSSKSDFLRNRAEVSRAIGPLRLGVRDEHERNLFRFSEDSLSALSYQFLEWEGFVTNKDTAKVTYRMFYKHREDQRPLNNQLNAAAKAEEYGLSFGNRGGGNHRIDVTTTFRRLEILREELIAQDPEDNFLGRLEYHGRLLNKGIDWTTFYNLGSGLERRRQFVYIEVPAGQGVYVWNDYNDNGVKELDEFEIATFTYEADHIRTFTPTDDFEQTYSNILGQTIRIEPSRWWKEETDWRGFLSKFSNQAVWRSERKTKRDEEISVFDPFVTDIQDSTLLSSTTSIRNTLYFQKTDHIWGIDFNIQENGSKQLLTNGFESRQSKEQSVDLRLVVKKQWTLKLKSRRSNRLNRTAYSSNRNYNIASQGLEPSISFQPNRAHRLTLSGEYTDKKNTFGDIGEQAKVASLGADYQYSMLGKGSLQLTIEYFDIGYNAAENNSLAFEMLNGLRKGSNATWGLRLLRSLGDNLELNLTYDGRKSPTAPTIHAGGLQVRAFF